MKRTKFHCDFRISEQRCFCPAMKNVGAMCLRGGGGGGGFARF